MNLTDLTEVLRDRADLDATTHDARMAGIRGRVLARRRRLALTGVVGVVLALVGVVYVALPGQRVDPAEPTRSLAEYQSGARLVAQAWGDLPATSITLTHTPSADDLVLIAHCVDEDSGQNLVTMVSINGRDGPAGGCTGQTTVRIDLSAYGGSVGEPLVVRMVVGVNRVAGEFPETVADVRPPESATSAEYAVGLGERVPLTEYSFPPRPETLEPLDSLLAPADFDLRSDPDDPDAPQELDVTWRGQVELTASLNTPGRLEVLIDGESVYVGDSWTYLGTIGVTTVGGPDGPDLAVGETATITVVPERTTGDWAVQFTWL
ncbi:hypothetical protein BLA60_36515 [Actinophytocola xinjiangensis]|uniref:Uncharacterized protein n=1 Tax=Actinophytocola xinjiangensis TaxID=485602 RepID=A0A7Z0WEA5_9PSEU|nr:hypothetical protein [Actinophytocola xinjiangensis]OLF05335.1 hypothetical protein BLA60_36515 [Actinophytocola xinjiangensis]